MSYHSTTIEYSLAALVAIAVFLVFVHPPQVIVYETADEKSLRVCQNTAIECSNQLTQCGKDRADASEQLRVCQKYQPDNTPWFLLIIWIPMLVWAGFTLRGVWDDHQKTKRLIAESKKEEAPK